MGQASSIETVRGRAVNLSPAHRTKSIPRGNNEWLPRQIVTKSDGRPSTVSVMGSRNPGPLRRNVRPAPNAFTWQITVADVSGDSCDPAGNRARSGRDTVTA